MLVYSYSVSNGWSQLEMKHGNVFWSCSPTEVNIYAIMSPYLQDAMSFFNFHSLGPIGSSVAVLYIDMKIHLGKTEKETGCVIAASQFMQWSLETEVLFYIQICRRVYIPVCLSSSSMTCIYFVSNTIFILAPQISAPSSYIHSFSI